MHRLSMRTSYDHTRDNSFSSMIGKTITSIHVSPHVRSDAVRAPRRTSSTARRAHAARRRTVHVSHRHRRERNDVPFQWRNALRTIDDPASITIGRRQIRMHRKPMALVM